jgi:hypothetical protein
MLYSTDTEGVKELTKYSIRSENMQELSSSQIAARQAITLLNRDHLEMYGQKNEFITLSGTYTVFPKKKSFMVQVVCTTCYILQLCILPDECMCFVWFSLTAVSLYLTH